MIVVTVAGLDVLVQRLRWTEKHQGMADLAHATIRHEARGHFRNLVGWHGQDVVFNRGAPIAWQVEERVAREVGDRFLVGGQGLVVEYEVVVGLPVDG